MSDGLKYIHGYSQQEQQRLLDQARMQEAHIYSHTDFSGVNTLLEIGCGVGAQTKILCERFPHLKITSVDSSKEQIQAASENLKTQIESGQVTLQQIGTDSLPFADKEFDGVFICWVLEHVSDPQAILKEAYRVLPPRGVIYCNEVANSTFHVNPYSPNILKYWFEFNDYQRSLGGDPFIGGSLANHLLNAGFKNVETHVLTHHFDNREPELRAEFIDYWTGILLSGYQGLLDSGRVDDIIVEGMKEELESLKRGPDSVAFFSWIFASGRP